MSGGKFGYEQYRIEDGVGVDALVRLPERVRTRVCPGCGYAMTQTAVDLSRFNFECARCGKYKLSDFLPSDAI